MENATREALAFAAREAALKPFHGYLPGRESNLEPIVRRFPKWNLREADRLWCAAFVYHCCIESGFAIPCKPGPVRDVQPRGVRRLGGVRPRRSPPGVP